MPDVPLLSVCIPTYNRLAKLRRLLGALLPQLTPACELVIIDNHSEQVMEVGLQDLLENFQTCDVKIIRNAVNIGANANILRCFESAQGDWIWITGDDDLPTEDAVACMLEKSGSNTDVIFINFGSNLLDFFNIRREKEWKTEGLTGFIETMDSFGHTLYVSVGLYRRAPIIAYLRQSYAFIDTCAPHVALVLICLVQNGGTTIFSHHRTVRWSQAEKVDHWDAPVVFKKIQRLLDIIPTAPLRERWFALTKTHMPPPLRTIPSLFKYVVSKKGDLNSARDQLEMASYLGTMVPSCRFHFLVTWLTAYAAFLTWFPFYVAWSWLPKENKGSLSNYALEQDYMHRFLNDTRL